MKMQVTLFLSLSLTLAASQAATTRSLKVPEKASPEHAPIVQVTSSTASPAIGQSQDNRTQQLVGQATSDVTKTIKSKKSDAAVQPGSQPKEEYRKFSGVRYTPLDLADYILRTRDEEGVALAIEELLREGLINRDEAILYLESVKTELQTMKTRYEHAQDTAPHRVPQIKVQPHPAYESKRKNADPKRSEADLERLQTPHSIFREQQEQEQLQEQQLRHQQLAEQRAKQLEMIQLQRQEQMRAQQQLQQEQEMLIQQEEQQRQQQRQQEQQQQELLQQQELQQQQQQLKQHQQEQKQQLPMQLAKLVKVKAEKQKPMEQQQQRLKSELLTNKTPKQPIKVYNGTGQQQTPTEQEQHQPQQQEEQLAPKPPAREPQNQAEKQVYDDYLLENVIYQLAKDMFSQSMIRDNASAEQLLSRFASFLEGELADKRFSKEAQTKIMDTVSAALVESLRERLYLEN